MSDVDTTKEAVAKTSAPDAARMLADRLDADAGAPDGARYQPYTDGRMRDAAWMLRQMAADRAALLAERDALRARVDAAEALVAELRRMQDETLAKVTQVHDAMMRDLPKQACAALATARREGAEAMQKTVADWYDNIGCLLDEDCISGEIMAPPPPGVRSMTAPDEFDPQVVEAVARAIVGPWLPVPDGCQFTLDQLRDVRWRRSSPQEQGMARTQALAILRTLRGLGVLALPHECVVPREPTEAMLIAGARRSDDFWSEKGPYCRTKAVYRAMLAAAVEEAAACSNKAAPDA